MKTRIRHSMLLTLSILVQVGASSLNSEFDHLYAIEDQMKSYERRCGKEATYSNLMDTISVDIRKEPNRRNELFDAIYTMMLMQYESFEVEEKVKRCLEINNLSDDEDTRASSLKAQCAHIIRRTDPEYAKKIYLDLLSDTNRMHSRIMIATALASMGDFSGEYLLEEGLKAEETTPTFKLSTSLKNTIVHQRKLMAGEPVPERRENTCHISKFLDENNNFSIEKLRAYEISESKRIREEFLARSYAKIESNKTAQASEPILGTNTTQSMALPASNAAPIDPANTTNHPQTQQTTRTSTIPWKGLVPIVGIPMLALLTFLQLRRKGSDTH